MLLQAHQDPTTGDQIHALLEDPHVARLKEEANRDPHYRQLRGSDGARLSSGQTPDR